MGPTIPSTPAFKYKEHAIDFSLVFFEHYGFGDFRIIVSDFSTSSVSESLDAFRALTFSPASSHQFWLLHRYHETGISE
jgi:hypothetical protein